MSLNVFYSNVWNRQPLPKPPFSTFSSQQTPWCSFLNSKLTSLCSKATGSHWATVCAYPLTFPEHALCGSYFWCLWLNAFRALPIFRSCPQIPLACWTEFHVVDISYFFVQHPEKMDWWLSSPEIWKKWVAMKSLCVLYFLGREQGVESLGCTFSMTLNWFPLMGGASCCSCRPHCVCPDLGSFGGSVWFSHNPRVSGTE